MNNTPRTPLKDISKQLLSDLKEQKQQSHKTCLSCLLHCTSWVLDINDITDENAPIKKLTMRNPSIVYKHCQSQDQQDMLDDMIDRDFNSPSFNDEMILHRSPTVSQSQYLDTIGTLFPIRNKAKTLNSHIINFEFENQLKQEVFMLEFDLEALLKFEDLIKIFPLDFSINQKNFIFKINGYCHGQTVFTDELHYILKGSKVLKSSVDHINLFKQRISAMPMNQFVNFQH